MFGATVLVPLITGFNVSITFFTCGLGTVLYFFITKKKMPVFLGSSFAFIGAALSIAHGEASLLPYVSLGTVFAGAVYLVLAGIVTYDGVAAQKEAYKDTVDIQIVAFPQVGLMKCPAAKELMAEAMRRGADVVGKMPANENTPDDSRAHVKFCFDLSEKYNADIDMHVDETDDPFYRTLEMVCALAAYVIEKVAKAGMRIITNPPTNLMLEGRMDKRSIPLEQPTHCSLTI